MLKKIASGDVHFKELLKGSLLSFILRIFGTLFGFLVTLVTTKFYGIASLGIVTILSNLLQFLIVLSKMGFDAACLRFIAGFNKDLKADHVKEVYLQSTKFVLLTSLTISIVLYFSSAWVAELVFHKVYLERYIKWLAFVLTPMSLLYLNRESLRGLKKITAFSFFSTSSIGLFSLITLLTFQFYDTEPYVPVISQNIAVVVSFLISLFLWFRFSNFNKVRASQEVPFKQIYIIALPLFLGSFLLLINTTASSFVLSIFRSEAEVGVFNVAQKISAICNISLVAVNSIAAPKFAEMYAAKKNDELKKIVFASSKIIFWSTFPVIIFILLFHNFILSFFDADLSQVVPSLMLLTIAQLVNGIAGSVGLILQMAGEQKTFRNIAVYTSIINIGLSFLLIPILGVIGAAMASSIAYCFWNVVAVFAVKKKLNILTIYFPFRKYPVKDVDL